MDLHPSAQEPILAPPVRQAALRELASGDAAWVVVSGKMCAGKDFIGPKILPAIGYDGAVRVGYGDLIRVQAQGVIDVLTGRRESETVLAAEIAERFDLELRHAADVVGRIAPLVRDPEHSLSPSERTDFMRDILILFGSDWRTDRDPQYWSRRAAIVSLGLLAEGTSVYLTGGRFLPDVVTPKNYGAKIVRLDVTEETQKAYLRKRDGLNPDYSVLYHPSETSLDDWDGFDVRVSNNGSEEECINAIVEGFRKLGMVK